MKIGLMLITLAATILWTHAQSKQADERPPCCRNMPGSGHFTDRSLYQLESKWTSDLGKEVRLGVLRGRPQVLTMFFTHCEFACPIIVQDMKRINAALPANLTGGVDFVLVTLDTERDSVQTLHAYRERQHLPLSNWMLLRGSVEDVRELAALLGVNYKQDERGQFAHSNLITILNVEGEIIHQQKGLNQKADDTVKVLSELLDNAARQPPEASRTSEKP